MKQMDRTLIQFAKTPVDGRVKTRLIPAFGARRARLLHEWLVERTLAVLQAMPTARSTLYIAGAVTGFWRTLQRDYPCELHTQGTGHLGHKMHLALSRELMRSRSVVLVGSDCPTLDPDYLEQAFHQLEAGRDLVLGPAEDGGYVLVGMRKPCAALFEEVDWGQARVLEQTLANADRLNLQTALLDTRWDVDLPPDVQRLAEREPAVRQLLSSAPDAVLPFAGG